MIIKALSKLKELQVGFLELLFFNLTDVDFVLGLRHERGAEGPRRNDESISSIKQHEPAHEGGPEYGVTGVLFVGKRQPCRPDRKNRSRTLPSPDH